MADSKVDVSPEAVQELAVAIDSFSARATFLMETVDAEIRGELDMMDSIREQIEKKWEAAKEILREAQNELSDAENDLAACEASQEKDEDGNWCPSCDLESYRVDVAQEKVKAAEDEEYKWRSNYERAGKIISWQKHCVEQFWREPSFLIPAGPGYELKRISGDYSEKLVSHLDECLEQLGIYEQTNLSLDVKRAVDSGAMEKPAPVFCQNCGRPIRNCVCRRIKKS